MTEPITEKPTESEKKFPWLVAGIATASGAAIGAGVTYLITDSIVSGIGKIPKLERERSIWDQD